MNAQRQDVEKNAIAIQSGRDTVIQSGVTTEQMNLILSTLAQQMPAYVTIARDLVNDRVSQLQTWILHEFSHPRADPRAFEDPDFQYLLAQAQHGYARSGDEELGHTLVSLISERSRQPKRSRTTLSLNAAIETAPKLTDEDIACCSLVFLIKYVSTAEVTGWGTFLSYFKERIAPLIEQVPRTHFPWMYLEAMRCGTYEGGQVHLWETFNLLYGGLFQNGFTMDELEQASNNVMVEMLKKANLIRICHNDPKKFQFNVIRGGQELVDRLNAAGIPDQISTDLVVDLFDDRRWSAEHFRTRLKPVLKGFRELTELWEEQPCLLNTFRLSGIGLAIGYSNIKRNAPLWDAPLSNWVL